METLFTPWRQAYLTQPTQAGCFFCAAGWAGDTNFMTVLAEVRLVPDDLGQTRECLRALFAWEPEQGGTDRGGQR